MRRGHGFTLIELIVVIVLLGVMAAGAGLLITRPIEAYNAQVRRQQLVDLAEMALRKIAVDIRAAVPNSVRVVNNSPNGWVLEMVNVVDGARYRDEFDPLVADDENDVLDFTQPDQDFNILGEFPNYSEWSLDQASMRLVIYSANQIVPVGQPNQGELEIYVDAVSGGNRAMISGAGVSVANSSAIAGEHRVALSTQHHFEYASPGQRLFVVDTPVSYLCDTSLQRLTRYAGYGFSATQKTANAQFTSGSSAPVATGLTACEIDYQPGTAQRSGLITLALTLRDAAGEQVRLLHQVHVDNVP